ncbi:GTP-binding protein [Clostridium tarantellae]|uniref:CobW/HypB/UreG nucleotide-binding domain-containing protein n=1 Tax=Clostridium tarantellae TaxID=39493 RepID=A0A6I1MI48_9CLOT|nr:GTP-binding protein [Clostridium tarantellae]MPQ42574.1 hypothetical protein [Clostridium tarantellae]
MRKCSIDLVTGFLSSGKSSFINFYLDNINNKKDIVLIQCEKGKELINNKIITLKEFKSNEELTEERILRIIKFYSPNKIIIECNGVGDITKIIEIINNKKLKQYFKLGTIITMVDCSTFNIFYKNIASIMLPYIKLSNLIVLNKCNLVSNDMIENNKMILEELNLKAHIFKCNLRADLIKIFDKRIII